MQGKGAAPPPPPPPPPPGLKAPGAAEEPGTPYSGDVSTEPPTAVAARRSHDTAYTSGGDSSRQGEGRGEEAGELEEKQQQQRQQGGNGKKEGKEGDGGKEEEEDDKDGLVVVDEDEGPYKGGNHGIVIKILMSYLQVRAG